MIRREMCSTCEFPLAVCVCSAVTQTTFETEIVILQHPTENNRAKNTARLIALVAPNTSVIVGESAADFDQVRQRLLARNLSDGSAAVLFPSPDSKTLTKHSESVSKKIQTLILIDGTWRKAKKMWQLNPWLWSLVVFSFDSGSKSRYRIRKGSEAGGLSTLEAAALALEILEDADTAPLYAVFEAMQNKWPQFSEVQ